MSELELPLKNPVLGKDPDDGSLFIADTWDGVIRGAYGSAYRHTAPQWSAAK